MKKRIITISAGIVVIITAAFVITGHYLNTAGDIVQRMVNEGHIVTSKYLMPGNDKSIKCKSNNLFRANQN